MTLDHPGNENEGEKICQSNLETYIEASEVNGTGKEHKKETLKPSISSVVNEGLLRKRHTRLVVRRAWICIRLIEHGMFNG